MHNKLQTYKIWAPPGALYTDWAKPVLFAASGRREVELNPPAIRWTGFDAHTAIIVDLPGKSGVEEGLALARMGYRPVPLYNGVAGPPNNAAIVNVDDISNGLATATKQLQAISIRPDAPPAFLLDFNRMQGHGKLPGRFDNRWCIFPQDMPSANFLKNHGINRVVVRGAAIQNDLCHIVLRYQQQGIAVFVASGDGPPVLVTVSKPSQFRSLLYRMQVMVGLTRNATGGFGATVPMPQERYYGYG